MKKLLNKQKNSAFLFKLFILRSNTVDLNPPPQKRVKLENHIISMFVQKKKYPHTLIRKADWVT